MCNSPATFQSMMDKIFVTMIEGKLVIIYMGDDAIVMLLPAEIAEIAPIHKGYKIDWTS